MPNLTSSYTWFQHSPLHTSVKGRPSDSRPCHESRITVPLGSRLPVRQICPSESIRLIQILPGTTLPIRCRMKTFNTRESVPYVCLSYQWGPEEKPEDMKTIEINGAKFRVRDNLWNFLYTARSKHFLRGSARQLSSPWWVEASSLQSPDRYEMKTWVWIDAICIDQENLTEKSEQVQRMGAIYRCAQFIMIWLGRPRNHERHESQQNVAEMEAKLCKARSRIPNSDKHQYRELWRVARHELELIEGSLKSTYWTRAWIVQEIELNLRHTIWFGNLELSLVRMQNLYLGMLKLRILGMQPSMDAFIRRTGRASRVRSPLSFLLSQYTEVQCGEASDRIYSLLAMATEGPLIKVDYTTGPAALFFRVIWACRNDLCFCTLVRAFHALKLQSLGRPISSEPHDIPYIEALMVDPKLVKEFSGNATIEGILRHMKETLVALCSCFNFLVLPRPLSRAKGILFCLQDTVCMLGSRVHILLQSDGESITRSYIISPFCDFGRGTSSSALNGVTMRLCQTKGDEGSLSLCLSPSALFSLLNYSTVEEYHVPRPCFKQKSACKVLHNFRLV